MIAVTDEVERKKVSDLNASIRGIDSDPYYGAPAIVLILAKASDGAAAEDGSNVAIYLMLAAEACGLSSVWIAKEPEMFEKEEGKQLLRDWGVEGEYVGVAAVALGYAAGERPEAAPRKKDYIKYI